MRLERCCVLWAVVCWLSPLLAVSAHAARPQDRSLGEPAAGRCAASDCAAGDEGPLSIVPAKDRQSGVGLLDGGAQVQFVAAPTEQEGALSVPSDLSGWVEEQHNFYKAKHPNVKTWSAKDGVVACDGSTGNCGFLRYDKKLGDFVLRLEYRIAKHCNSGVCIRTAVPYDGRPDKTLPSHVGYEVQVLDDAGAPASKTSSGAFYGLVAPRSNAAKPAGEWNTLEIACTGPKIRVTLNGQVVQDVDQTQIEAIRDRPRAGYIALQNHGGHAEFRNIRLQAETPPRETHTEKAGNAKQDRRANGAQPK